MFEGNIRNQGEDGLPETPVGTEMHPLDWGELAIRLEASRDFRRILRDGTGRAAGSFDLGSAHYLAAFEEGQPGVNPIALVNGKMAEGKGSGVKYDESTGDRGR